MLTIQSVPIRYCSKKRQKSQKLVKQRFSTLRIINQLDLKDSCKKSIAVEIGMLVWSTGVHYGMSKNIMERKIEIMESDTSNKTIANKAVLKDKIETVKTIVKLMKKIRNKNKIKRNVQELRFRTVILWKLACGYGEHKVQFVQRMIDEYSPVKIERRLFTFSGSSAVTKELNYRFVRESRGYTPDQTTSGATNLFDMNERIKLKSSSSLETIGKLTKQLNLIQEKIQVLKKHLNGIDDNREYELETKVVVHEEKRDCEPESSNSNTESESMNSISCLPTPNLIDISDDSSVTSYEKFINQPMENIEWNLNIAEIQIVNLLLQIKRGPAQDSCADERRKCNRRSKLRDTKQWLHARKSRETFARNSAIPRFISDSLAKRIIELKFNSSVGANGKYNKKIINFKRNLAVSGAFNGGVLPPTRSANLDVVPYKSNHKPAVLLTFNNIYAVFLFMFSDKIRRYMLDASCDSLQDNDAPGTSHDLISSAKLAESLQKVLRSSTTRPPGHSNQLACIDHAFHDEASFWVWIRKLVTSFLESQNVSAVENCDDIPVVQEIKCVVGSVKHFENQELDCYDFVEKAKSPKCSSVNEVPKGILDCDKLPKLLNNCYITKQIMLSKKGNPKKLKSKAFTVSCHKSHVTKRDLKGWRVSNETYMNKLFPHVIKAFAMITKDSDTDFLISNEAQENLLQIGFEKSIRLAENSRNTSSVYRTSNDSNCASVSDFASVQGDLRERGNEISKDITELNRKVDRNTQEVDNLSYIFERFNEQLGIDCKKHQWTVNQLYSYIHLMQQNYRIGMTLLGRKVRSLMQSETKLKNELHRKVNKNVQHTKSMENNVNCLKYAVESRLTAYNDDRKSVKRKLSIIKSKIGSTMRSNALRACQIFTVTKTCQKKFNIKLKLVVLKMGKLSLKLEKDKRFLQRLIKENHSKIDAVAYNVTKLESASDTKLQAHKVVVDNLAEKVESMQILLLDAVDKMQNNFKEFDNRLRFVESEHKQSELERGAVDNEMNVMKLNNCKNSEEIMNNSKHLKALRNSVYLNRQLHENIFNEMKIAKRQLDIELRTQREVNENINSNLEVFREMVKRKSGYSGCITNNDLDDFSEKMKQNTLISSASCNNLNDLSIKMDTTVIYVQTKLENILSHLNIES